MEHSYCMALVVNSTFDYVWMGEHQSEDWSLEENVQKISQHFFPDLRPETDKDKTESLQQSFSVFDKCGTETAWLYNSLLLLLFCLIKFVHCYCTSITTTITNMYCDCKSNLFPLNCDRSASCPVCCSNPNKEPIVTEAVFFVTFVAFCAFVGFVSSSFVRLWFELVVCSSRTGLGTFVTWKRETGEGR